MVREYVKPFAGVISVKLDEAVAGSNDEPSYIDENAGSGNRKFSQNVEPCYDMVKDFYPSYSALKNPSIDWFAHWSALAEAGTMKLTDFFAVTGTTCS